jgi:hypothetical protein
MWLMIMPCLSIIMFSKGSPSPPSGAHMSLRNCICDFFWIDIVTLHIDKTRTKTERSPFAKKEPPLQGKKGYLSSNPKQNKRRCKI